MNKTVLELVNIHYHYKQGEKRVDVLRDLSLTIAAGQVVGLIGASGTGKSTLLHLAGLLDGPQQGKVLLEGQETNRLTQTEKAALRNKKLGFVYQFHHLLRDFTALENVSLPQQIAGVADKHANERSLSLLSALGLGGRATHKPMQLSGGEQQRVAIARALANKPALLLADEPTGNLDPETADNVFKEMLTQAREQGTATLIATHNHALAAKMDVVYRLVGGALEKYVIS